MSRPFATRFRRWYRTLRLCGRSPWAAFVGAIRLPLAMKRTATSPKAEAAE